MSDDRTVRDAMLETVLSQIETGDPPETKQTYERLMAAGVDGLITDRPGAAVAVRARTTVAGQGSSSNF